MSRALGDVINQNIQGSYDVDYACNVSVSKITLGTDCVLKGNTHIIQNNLCASKLKGTDVNVLKNLKEHTGGQALTVVQELLGPDYPGGVVAIPGVVGNVERAITDINESIVQEHKLN